MINMIDLLRNCDTFGYYQSLDNAEPVPCIHLTENRITQYETSAALYPHGNIKIIDRNDSVIVGNHRITDTFSAGEVFHLVFNECIRTFKISSKINRLSLLGNIDDTISFDCISNIKMVREAIDKMIPMDFKSTGVGVDVFIRKEDYVEIELST